MKRLLPILLGIAILNGKATAQDNLPYGYYIDALRFSQTYTGGTAMNLALGGANTALGAELTSISGNPAGLGLYNRSEFAFTPGFTFAENKTSVNGFNTRNQNNYWHLGNIGIVLNKTKDEIGGWLGGSFGFSVNKVNDFNAEYRYNLVNDQNSLVDYFIESANGLPASQMPNPEDATDLTTLAYHTYLIGPLEVFDTTLPDDEYFSDVTSSSMRPVVNQQETIKTSGSQYQWSLSYGGNLADVLYIGFGVGVVNLNYTAEKFYEENNYDYSADDPTYDPINSIQANETLKINGTGVNATFGLILRPVSFIRLGASITSPTVYNINDRYNTSLAADWNNFFYGDLIGGDTTLNYLEARSAEVLSRYSITTPFRASGGVAVFLGKLGFVTVDVEYLDYRKIYLEGEDFSLDADNEFMAANFSEALNIKSGVEIRMDDLRLRAGYAIDNVPLTANWDYKSPNHRISAGAGLHFENFFADFTVINSMNKSYYKPYALVDGGEPEVEFKKNYWNALLTLGFKF